MDEQRNPLIALIEEWDDKSQAMFIIGVLGVVALIMVNDPETIVSSAISGIAGMAFGKRGNE